MGKIDIDKMMALLALRKKNKAKYIALKNKVSRFPSENVMTVQQIADILGCSKQYVAPYAYATKKIEKRLKST